MIDCYQRKDRIFVPDQLGEYWDLISEILPIGCSATASYCYRLGKQDLDFGQRQTIADLIHCGTAQENVAILPDYQS